jgi:hypothetical protein
MRPTVSGYVRSRHYWHGSGDWTSWDGAHRTSKLEVETVTYTPGRRVSVIMRPDGMVDIRVERNDGSHDPIFQTQIPAEEKRDETD